MSNSNAELKQRKCVCRVNKKIRHEIFKLFMYAEFKGGIYVLGDPEVTTDIYCKSRNLPNTDTQNYSTDLR